MYKIEFKNESSIPVCMLLHSSHWISSPPSNQRALGERYQFEIKKSFSLLISYSNLKVPDNQDPQMLIVSRLTSSNQVVWTLRSQSIIGQFTIWAHFVQDSVESTSPERLSCMQNYAFRFGISRFARKKVYSPMGINCLFPFVKNQLKSVNIKDFGGKRIAVDASCWLHKALSVSMRRTGSFARWGTNVSHWIQVLRILHFRSYTCIILESFQWR